MAATKVVISNIAKSYYYKEIGKRPECNLLIKSKFAIK
jgi:hypothetical protein